MKRIESVMNLLSNMMGLIRWPLVVIIFIALFHSPIHNAIGNINKIEIGELVVQIEKDLESVGQLELAGTLRSLSDSSVRTLLMIGDKSRKLVGTGPDYYILTPNHSDYFELSNEGLLTISDGMDLEAFTEYFNSLDMDPKDGRILFQDLEPDEKELLEEHLIKLSDSGLLIFNTIVSAVANTI